MWFFLRYALITPISFTLLMFCCALINCAAATGMESWERFDERSVAESDTTPISIRESMLHAEDRHYQTDELQINELQSGSQVQPQSNRTALSISEIQPMVFQEVAANENREVSNQRDARFMVEGQRQETFRVTVSDAAGNYELSRVTMYSNGARHSFPINIEAPATGSLAGNGRRRISISGVIPATAFPLRGGSYTGTYRVLVEYDD